jgi:hypothetical protein
MATAAEIQTIATDSRCFLCVSDKQLIAMSTYLLWLGLNPGGSMTAAEIQTLATDSRCLADCLSQKQLAAAMVLLLLDGGGGGGGSGLTWSSGAGAPEGVVIGSPGDRYWDTNTDFEYVKLTGTATNTGWAIH